MVGQTPILAGDLKMEQMLLSMKTHNGLTAITMAMVTISKDSKATIVHSVGAIRFSTAMAA